MVLVVEKLFVFGDDEQLRAAFTVADFFDRSVEDDLFDDGRSIQHAEFLARFGVADLSAHTSGSLADCLSFQLRIAIAPATVHRSDLTDERFHAGITSRHVNNMSAREGGTPDSDPIGIASLVASRPVNRIQNVGRLVDRVGSPSDIFNLGKQFVLLHFWHTNGDQTRVALAPSAIVDLHDEESRSGEDNGIRSKCLTRPAPAVAHDDGRHLAVGIRRRKHFRRDPSPFADDVGAAEGLPGLRNNNWY